MTLVLSCATQDYLVQACDRRLITNRGDLVDDNANKAVLFTNRLAFSYTGLANIGSERTDLWLTKTLAALPTGSLSDAIRAVRSKATEAFKHISLPSGLKRHAFVGAGWTRARVEEPLQPLLCLVSNFHDRQGETFAEDRDEFTTVVQILSSKNQLGFLAIGQALPGNRHTVLWRNLRRCAQHKVSPNLLVRFLVDEITEVSNSNKAVGRGILSVVLPRSIADSHEVVVVGGSPVPGMATFQYYPADRHDGIVYGPNVAGPGFGATNFRAGNL